MTPISRPELAALVDLGLGDDSIAHYLRTDLATLLGLRERYGLVERRGVTRSSLLQKGADQIASGGTNRCWKRPQTQERLGVGECVPRNTGRLQKQCMRGSDATPMFVWRAALRPWLSDLRHALACRRTRRERARLAEREAVRIVICGSPSPTMIVNDRTISPSVSLPGSPPLVCSSRHNNAHAGHEPPLFHPQSSGLFPIEVTRADPSFSPLKVTPRAGAQHSTREHRRRSQPS